MNTSSMPMEEDVDMIYDTSLIDQDLVDQILEALHFNYPVVEPTNVTSKIQENNKKDDHEAFTPHHYEFLADSSTKQQPVNEAHGHVPEIPLIGSENNDQVVFEAFRQVSEKDTQLYIDAPLEEEGGEWIQRLRNSLTRMNTSSMPMEEDVDMIYDTSLIDQDLVDQYATLRPQESFKL
ncbi:hypothetical protein Bca52824_036305 [Brassica carinata]|uniref:Uncharacterized protein n=1 Tax=Brassica carinata TaxID=52824 RepID=A0A8X7S520_BRACI|nr:hypothetical protein Bca52824_036305 [Brassica carinata]